MGFWGVGLICLFWISFGLGFLVVLCRFAIRYPKYFIRVPVLLFYVNTTGPGGVKISPNLTVMYKRSEVKCIK